MKLDESVLKDGVLAIVTDSTKGFYYVATNTTGDIVGQLMITYEWSDWKNAQIWWIQSVYVVKPYRKLGIFKQLYHRARHDATEAQACGLRLYAYKDNANAHMVYKRLGMVSEYAVFEDMF